MSPAIALFASARRHGNTGRLLDEVAGRVRLEIVDLAGKSIAPYDYQHRNRGDDFEPLIDRVLEHDHIVFASPVYWYAVSPPLKVFLDRISDLLDLPDLREKGRRLRGKRAYVLCTSIEPRVPKPFIGAFRETFAYLGMEYGGCLHADCREGYRGEQYHGDIEAFARQLGEVMAGA